MLTEDQIRFTSDFASELLRINRTALHLFIDEAHTFAPQMVENRAQKVCLGTVSRLVKQGGVRGCQGDDEHATSSGHQQEGSEPGR